MDNTQLTHHGIKGMKWGVRRTQAQLGHKPSSKKNKPSLKERFEAKKKLKAKQKAAEIARKAKQAKEEYEAEKKKALESGTAGDILKFKGKLTNQELTSAVTRLNMESRLSEMNSNSTKTGLDKVESVMDKVDRVRGAAEKGISAWNTFAKVYNSFNKDNLPVIDGNFKDRNKAKREREEKEYEEFKAKQAKEAKARNEEREARNEKKRARRAERMNKRKEFIKRTVDYANESGYKEKIKERLFKKKKKDTGNVYYNTTFVDVTSSGEISSGRSYVSGLLGPGIDDQRG